jgi:hypothetical protein
MMNTEHNENSRVRNTIRVVVAASLLTGILLGFNQCVVDKSSTGKLKSSLSKGGNAGDITTDGNSLPDGLTMPPMNTTSTSSDNDELDVGVKSFDQVYQSMAVATGVKVNYDGNLVNTFNILTTSLPSNNDIASFLPNNQIAVTKLSAEFCQRLVEDATLRAAIWPTLNFTQAPKTIFATANKAANKQTIINQAIDRFLPPLDTETRTDTYNQLSDLFEALLDGTNVNDSAVTRNVVKGMCITTLSSAHATIL